MYVGMIHAGFHTIQPVSATLLAIMEEMLDRELTSFEHSEHRDFSYRNSLVF